jgi:hypothetical protein
MAFHADGTILQANADAARAQFSDSVGMGEWRTDDIKTDGIEDGRDNGTVVIGRFVEVTARRDYPAATERTSVRFRLVVRGDTFDGMAQTPLRRPGRPIRRDPLATRVTIDEPCQP